MAIGYACLTVGVRDTKFRTCRKDRATDEKLISLIKSNLASLNRIFDYNIQNDIKLFRISSDIIPFGSHLVNQLKWWEIFADELHELGNKALSGEMRLSMHPGQYAVLNSNNSDVVDRAVDDLQYHARFLEALGLDRRHKIVLHIGGAYGNKVQAMERFKTNYQKLDENIKARLAIENDDKIYNIQEVLSLGKELGIPVIYDNLHYEVNSYEDKTDTFWIQEVAKTWKPEDGLQKVHYSQQHENKKAGSHSNTIDLEKFLTFYHEVQGEDLDIMLEVKDKNLSAVKCLNGAKRGGVQDLEKEWARYKYLVLEHSPKIYQQIRELLKDKSVYKPVEFYRLIDCALTQETDPGKVLNAGEHVWGHFKNQYDEKDKRQFERSVEKIKAGNSARSLKRLLWNMAKAYGEKYLLESLYFKDVM